MSLEWPLVGREEELSLIEERLTAEHPRAIVVAGPAGVGKTRLASELLARAEANGWTGRRVVASRSAASVPFGAWAPLLPDLDRIADTRYTFLRRAAQAIADLGPKLLLVIDDAHHLDDASATLVHQLADDGNVAMLLTIRSGERAPDAVSLLWKDGFADRLELQALARAEMENLVEAVLAGTVDGAVTHYLWTASQGNPLYLRELVSGCVDTRAIYQDGDIWRLSDHRDTPPRLIELVEARVGDVDPEEQHALELLAFAETLGLAALETLVDRAVVDRLERRGLLSVGIDGNRRPVRLAHPLYGDVLRAQASGVRTREIKRVLADEIASRNNARRADSLREATLRLDADGKADPDLLHRAMAEALIAYDVPLTERIARAGHAAGGGPAFTRLLGETLRWQGRHEEAESILGAIDLASIDDEEQRALFVLTRAECLFRGLGRKEDALRALGEGDVLVDDQRYRDEMRALVGTIHTLSGDVTEAIEVLTPVLDAADPRPKISAAIGLSPALAMSGRTDDAVAVSERAFGEAMQLGPQPGLGDPGIHVVARCLALAYAGRLAEAQAPARVGYDWSLATSILIGQSWFAMLLGLIHLSEGRPQTAIRYFREASAGFRDLVEPGLLRWCLAGVVQSSAMLGDISTARAALRDIDVVGDTPIQLAEVEVDRARAWLAAAEGHTDAALRELLIAAEEARERSLCTLEVLALHDVVRLGMPSAVAERLQELSEYVQGPFARTCAHHARASALGQGDALDNVSDAFEELGFFLLAAEVASEAAVVHARAGDDRLATASRLRSSALRERCEGARTPGLAVAEGGAFAPLTKREREIASLAAGGMPSRDIAAQLFLSVRTVENHLQRVYAKLGVSSRSELARVLQGR
ncbi:MAG: LuxR C-terminal-related transcriptional regulator [Acidimicrobiia bacterium]